MYYLIHWVSHTPSLNASDVGVLVHILGTGQLQWHTIHTILGVFTPGHSYWYQEQYGTIYKDEGSRMNETGTARDGGTINMQDGDVPNYSVKNIRIIILYGGITNENFRMDLIEHCLDQYCLCCLLYLSPHEE